MCDLLCYFKGSLVSRSISDRYGSPTDIKIKQSYLIRSIDAPSGVDWG